MSKQKLQSSPSYSLYFCNICETYANKPVITQCGHLYCWTCIYQKLNSSNDSFYCLACKNLIQSHKLVPLYTKHQQNDNLIQGIPSRPKPKRQELIPNPAAVGSGLPYSINLLGMNLQRGVLLAGYGLFPSVGTLLFQQNNEIQDTGLAEASPQIKYKRLFIAIRFVLFLLLVFIVLKY